MGHKIPKLPTQNCITRGKTRDQANEKILQVAIIKKRSYQS